MMTEAEIHDAIRLRIRFLMMKHELSRVEVAEFSGIGIFKFDKLMYGQVKRGFSVYEVHQLARVFRTNPGSLIQELDERERHMLELMK